MHTKTHIFKSQHARLRQEGTRRRRKSGSTAKGKEFNTGLQRSPLERILTEARRVRSIFQKKGWTLWEWVNTLKKTTSESSPTSPSSSLFSRHHRQSDFVCCDSHAVWPFGVKGWCSLLSKGTGDSDDEETIPAGTRKNALVSVHWLCTHLLIWVSFHAFCFHLSPTWIQKSTKVAQPFPFLPHTHLQWTTTQQRRENCFTRTFECVGNRCRRESARHKLSPARNSRSN